jgi:hypothetical protein
MFKSERKAKTYVRDTLENTLSISDLPKDKQIQELGEYYEKYIKEYENLSELQAREEQFIKKSNILKQRFIQLFVSGRYTQAEISKILHVSANTVNKWLHFESIRKEIEKFQEEENMIINASMKALRRKAIEKQSELLDDDNSMVAHLVAKDILDRTGHSAQQKSTVQVNVTYEQKLQQLLGNKEVQAEYTINGETQKINTEGEDTVMNNE